jgi:hypothetical protein
MDSGYLCAPVPVRIGKFACPACSAQACGYRRVGLLRPRAVTAAGGTMVTVTAAATAMTALVAIAALISL